MSRRHFLNISMGSTAFLMLIAIGAVLTNLGGHEDYSTQISLSEQQVQLVDDLNRQAGELTIAEDFPSVIKARKDLAASILRFDSTLSALLHGGALKVGVTAAPERGKANRAVLGVLAKALDLAPSALEILSGHASQDKIVDERLGNVRFVYIFAYHARVASGDGGVDDVDDEIRIVREQEAPVR